MISSTNQSCQIFSFKSWKYHSKEKKISKVNLEDTDIYQRVRCLGAGISGSVILYQSDPKGKEKAVKFSNGTHHLVKTEYVISLSWPKNAIGLLLRPKAYFREDIYDLYIMHKYDSPIKDLIYDLTLQEKIEAICQLCQGIATLHELKIAHRDVHLANVFYDKDMGRFDLGDFGQAITLNAGQVRLEIGIDKDLRDLKECIESILLGEEVDSLQRMMEGYRQRLNTFEEVSKLGFDVKVTWMIYDFMTSPKQEAKTIVNIFKKIREML